MAEYDKLVKALRGCKDIEFCTECPRMGNGFTEYCNIKEDAADAIEALQKAKAIANRKLDSALKRMPKRGEIVRCGECKWQRPEALNGSVYCRRHRFVKPDDWFCADGERKAQE